MDTIRSKCIEKGVEHNKLLQRTLDQLLHLVGHQEGSPLRSIEFHMGILRLEKRTLLTFASMLFSEEEVRLRGMNSEKSTRFVPDYALAQIVQTAIDDPNC